MMKIETPQHPAVLSLRETLDGLRTDPPQRNKGLKKRLEKLLGQFPRFPDHFLYIFNYTEGRVVYAAGFQEVLGYPDAEVDMDLVYSVHHPEDAPIVARLNQCAVKAMTEMHDPANLMDLCLTVDYRMRRADGQYIKILRQTAVFEVDGPSGKVHSTFSLCKDISAIKSSPTIGWQVRGFEYLDFEPPEGTDGRIQYRPTDREMEVVRMLADGKGSKAIAQELSISPMTVGTHRRNILQRTGMRNTAELMRHASVVGWV